MVSTTKRLRHNASKLVALPVALFVFLTLPALQPMTQCQEQDRPALRTINDVFADVAAKVPAFGGMFVDEDKDTLYVYLVPGQAGDVRAIDQAISDVFETERPPERRLEVLQGQYTFSQLREWDDRVGLRVLMVPGAVQSAIDHARNRLEVGVTSEAAVAGVEQVLAAAGVPRDAVIVEQVDPVREIPPAQEPGPAMTANPGTCDTRTLRDRCRPLVGGLQIQIEQGSATPRTCTLGFIAFRGEVPGFVTAGHCTPDESDPRSAIFFQPSVAQNNRVGLGEINPPFLTMEQNRRCFAGQRCRFSDSMFVKLDNGVQGTDGEIAQPRDGTIDWDGRARFNIVEKFVRDERRSIQGTIVQRVGSQSGWIQGDIALGDVRATSNGKTYIGQIEVAWRREVMDGDSGSPVFIIKRGSEPNHVILVGILWGSGTIRAMNGTVSPIENIELTDELGPTLVVCIPGWEC